MKYFKEVPENEAEFKIKATNQDSLLITRILPLKAVIDLSTVVGDKIHLFNFTNPGQWIDKQWTEGYLIDITPEGQFVQAAKRSGALISQARWVRCEFQTDRVYPWLGGDISPLPSGVLTRVWKTNRDPLIIKDAAEISWGDGVGAYQAIGAAPGWEYKQAL